MTEFDEDYTGYTPGNNFTYECLPEGAYDYVVHGIVVMGLRPASFEGKELSPRPEVKIIFEVPEHLREDKQTELLSVKMPISSNAKSNYYKFCTTVFGEATTKVEANMEQLCKGSGMKTLLGKTGTLTVVAWEKQPDKRSVSKTGFHPLHPKVEKPIPTREFVFFNCYNPDIDTFVNKLTYYTRKDIMAAVNADQFSDELKVAYKKSQEDYEAKKGKSDGAKEETSAPWAGSVDAIQ